MPSNEKKKAKVPNSSLLESYEELNQKLGFDMHQASKKEKPVGDDSKILLVDVEDDQKAQTDLFSFEQQPGLQLFSPKGFAMDQKDAYTKSQDYELFQNEAQLMKNR